MQRLFSPTLRAFADAVVIVAVLLLIRLAFWPILGNRLPFLTFLPAIVLGAYLGGMRGGLTATVLGSLAVLCVLAAPDHPFLPATTAEWTRLGLFAFIGAIISFFSELMHKAQRRAESHAERLRHSEAQQRITLASIGDGVIVTDREGRITLINAVAQHLTGWTAEEAVGQALGKVFAIFHEGTDQPREDPVARVLQDGRAVRLEDLTELRAKDGTRKPIDNNAAPVRDDRGAISGVVVVFHDTTERRRLERQRDESMRHHQTARRQAVQILESITDGFFAVDRSWRFTYVNQLAEQLLGRTREDLLGKQLWEEFPELLPSGSGRVFRRAMAESATVVHEEFSSPRGRWYEVHAYGSPEGVSVYFRDFTERRQARETLHRSEDRYRCLVRAAAQIVWTTDAAGQVMEDSPSWRAFTGQSLEQWLGNGWLDAVHPDDRGQAAAAWSQAIAHRTIYEIEYRLRTVDGGYRQTLARAVPVLEPDGRVREWVGMNTDVTERRRAQTELAETRLLFQRMAEATPDILYRYDLLAKRLVYVNRGLSQVLGYAPEHLLAMSEADFGALIHPDDQAAVAKIAARRPHMREEEVLEFEYRIRHADGSYRWLRSRDTIFTRTPDQQPHQLLGLAQDITRHKEVAEALRETDRRKDEFLAMLGHELRNPLAPIRNALQILRAGHAADSDVGDLTAMMERQVAHMVRLVEDLLDVSRISRGKIELRREPVDLTDLAIRTLDALRPVFEERQHRLETDLPEGPLLLEADAARLEQVLTNLLTNAVKYTPPEGLIRLELRREGHEVVLAVSDNGIGIRPDMLPRIFDMFQQADRLPGRVAEGLGLGLTLVRTLTEMHDGRVTASSTGPGCGSEFVVRLPLLPADLPAEAEVLPSIPAAGAAPAQVLVVDDNVDGADSLARVLQMAGHKVEIAYDGPEALAEARAHPPEIVLLDIGLPNGMDGYEVARRLRAECGLKHALLVAVTGYGQEDDRLRAREAGFDAHLTKPVDFAELNELLMEASKLSSEINPKSEIRNPKQSV
jgi:PAS domain S-box-containing protein